MWLLLASCNVHLLLLWKTYFDSRSTSYRVYLSFVIHESNIELLLTFLSKVQNTSGSLDSCYRIAIYTANTSTKFFSESRKNITKLRMQKRNALKWRWTLEVKYFLLLALQSFSILFLFSFLQTCKLAKCKSLYQTLFLRFSIRPCFLFCSFTLLYCYHLVNHCSRYYFKNELLHVFLWKVQHRLVHSKLNRPFISIVQSVTTKVIFATEVYF